MCLSLCVCLMIMSYQLEVIAYPTLYHSSLPNHWLDAVHNTAGMESGGCQAHVCPINHTNTSHYEHSLLFTLSKCTAANSCNAYLIKVFINCESLSIKNGMNVNFSAAVARATRAVNF